MKIDKFNENNNNKSYNDNNKRNNSNLIVCVFLYGGLIDGVISFDTLDLAYDFKLNYINDTLDSYDKTKYPTKEDIFDSFKEDFLMPYGYSEKELRNALTYDKDYHKLIFTDIGLATDWYYENSGDSDISIQTIENHIIDVDVPEEIKISNNAKKYNL